MDDPNKTAIYGHLNDLNQAVATITKSLNEIQAYGIVSAQTMTLVRLRAEELRAVVNHSLIINMAETEMADAGRYERLIKELYGKPE